jgi:hypothetical protein
VENSTNGEKAGKIKANDTQKSRNPLSDISNQVFERFTRPTQKSIKQGSIETTALVVPQIQERQPAKEKDLHIVIETEAVEEMEFDEDGKKVNKRRYSPSLIIYYFLSSVRFLYFPVDFLSC